MSYRRGLGQTPTLPPPPTAVQAPSCSWYQSANNPANTCAFDPKMAFATAWLIPNGLANMFAPGIVSLDSFVFPAVVYGGLLFLLLGGAGGK